ncbi:hypothetical protein Pyn_37589 [Prunus yedoensis var. nudiflora]|uniref:Uncharacterized protein n=1 Tax=Prunus yedoensis var. nudiflora TaxID=2094558 RepID=A0A314Y0C6_PRUYE|nr:hypothetical protein Pyn_37589 [Prunus yedoensis var. nudiflora]
MTPEAGDKRVRMDSPPPRQEGLPEVASGPMPQPPGKEKVSDPLIVDRRFKHIHLSVRTIKLEEGVDLLPYEPELGPDTATEGGVVRMSNPTFPGLSMPGVFRPRSELAVNLSSAEGRRVIMELRKLDVVLVNVVDELRSLWNLIRAPDFDPVAAPDTL